MTTMTTHRTKDLLMASMLTAIGILIPMFMPIKLILGPASYTLASHLPIFIAMFINPFVGITVALGTTLGFWFGGFPLVIVFRALSHVVFVTVGAYWLRHSPNLLKSPASYSIYAVVLNIIHALFEVLAVALFTFFTGGLLNAEFYSFLFIFVGLGTFIHGMVDFFLAYFVVKGIQKPLHWDLI